MSKYADIIARLEKAEGPDREIDGFIALVEGWTFEKMEGDRSPYWRKPGVTDYFMRSDLPRYTASIDAAIALVERILPDPAILLGYGQDALTKPWARISVSCGSSHGATLPLAILRALFRALDAKEDRT